MTARDLDLVLFGATGYLGRLTAAELARSAEAQRLRWALAGRDLAALQRVRDELAAAAPGAARVSLVHADARDQATLDAMARRARVVCSTVGPYAVHGSGLVDACARLGTDYCDITGERHWIRAMIDAHHERAAATGARIVHACGCDSVPSDLGTLLVQELAARELGRPCARVSTWFGEMNGRFGGGGVATALGSVRALRRDRALRRRIAHPYALDSPAPHDGPDGPDQRGVRFEPSIRQWTGPFVMAPINARVVRRTHALLGRPWGGAFRYREAASFGRGARGLAWALGTTSSLLGMAVASRVPGALALAAWLAPRPGTGPTAEQRAGGYFAARLVGELDGAPAVLAIVSDLRDPGCAATATMLAQAALCLAVDDLAGPGGVLTPAAALGLPLVARLRRAGMRLDAMRWSLDAVAASPFVAAVAPR